MVDIGRRPYTTKARFFKDDDRETTIRWQRAAEDAPVLGFPSAINSLDWQSHPWLKTGVGEVYGASRDYTAGTLPNGLNYDHVCGTEADHERGAEFDPGQNVQYLPNGLPVCCSHVPMASCLEPHGYVLGDWVDVELPAGAEYPVNTFDWWGFNPTVAGTRVRLETEGLAGHDFDVRLATVRLYGGNEAFCAIGLWTTLDSFGATTFSEFTVSNETLPPWRVRVFFGWNRSSLNWGFRWRFFIVP